MPAKYYYSRSPWVQKLNSFVSRTCTSLTQEQKSLLKWGFWTTPHANLGKNSSSFHISLSSFCRWTGTNLEGELVWAVPTLSSILVCIVLQDNTSYVIRLSKTGSFIKSTKIELHLITAIPTLILRTENLTINVRCISNSSWGVVTNYYKFDLEMENRRTTFIK